jgi:hypothetical protein
MIDDERDLTPELLADLVDGIRVDPEVGAWLARHPEVAAEVAIARRVRVLVNELRDVSIAVPADFEAQLMARVRQDQTLLDLLELALAGAGRALVEVLTILMGLLPQQPAHAA